MGAPGVVVYNSMGLPKGSGTEAVTFPHRQDVLGGFSEYRDVRRGLTQWGIGLGGFTQWAARAWWFKTLWDFQVNSNHAPQFFK